MTLSWLEFELFSVGDFSFTVVRLLSFLLIIIFTLLVSKVVRQGLKRLQGGAFEGGASLYALGRIIHYIILVVGFLIAVSTLGLDVGKLALLAGALGVGIGLGLQGIVNNFVSGVVILLERSLKVGDFIEVSSGLVGEVLEINIRSTLMRTNDNVDILIPNSELIGGMVTNWTLEENVRRFRIPFSVAYGSDKSMVKKAVLEAAAKVPYTLTSQNREPIVWMTGFGDSSLNFVLGVWVTPEQVKRPTALTSDYLWAIDDAFRQYKIEIPFPQRDVHVRSGLDGLSKPRV
ncbi:mechanosensitive ion channel family protein [Teredinibacter purpureus]|uniref:mechanosensitive ion channel family protein n=1 Tax=Teredinibacter purpureus TaxID=2731756 RepID=UPI0005F79B41|nr:mechanosensitive ion channel domain-containing protein [Teredinibacter purpureus]